MENTNKNSLIIFGYSEILTIALLVNSKLYKVKKFNILEDNNEDKFFEVISNFVSNKLYFNKVYYSCGPGGFTIIRKIISYVKALNFTNLPNTKFIGFNHLFIIACYINYKYKINEQEYILSILNHSKDNFVQIYQKKKNFCFFLDNLSDIENIDLDSIETYLENFNLSLKKIHSVCLGSNFDFISTRYNIHLIDRSSVIETIVKISDLIDNNRICKINYKYFFEENFNPLYGKLPSTN